MTSPSPAEQRVAIERERLAFDREQAANTSPVQNLLAILSAAVALFGVLFSATQVWTSYIAKQKELAIATLQSDAQMDQRWRADMLGFLERHEQRLFSRDADVAQQALTLLELSFPAHYVQPVRSKLNILLSSTESSDSGRLVESLLKPLIQQFDRTRAAFLEYQPGNLRAEAELRDGNQRARDLLVDNRTLIPEALRDDAARLVEHYEVWLQEYARLRNGEKPDIGVPVYAGPKGYPFPTESERRFRAELDRLTGAQNPR